MTTITVILAHVALVKNGSALSIQPTVSGMNDYWTPAQNFAKAVVNGEVTLDNAAAKTPDFYKQINTSIVSK